MLRVSEGEDARATELPDPVRALRAVQRASHDADAALARRMGLGASDVAALEHLLSASEPLGPAEVGQRLGMASAGATALVDRLERAGHVSRSPHPRDRRRQVLTVTPGSRNQTWTALQPLLLDLTAAAGELSAPEAAAVVRFLQAAAKAMERYADASP
jgi:DNA-binding MarR family transcriptional regulator